MEEVQWPPTKFHLFPELPQEIQDMVWKFYGKLYPEIRHEFHTHYDREGTDTHHYTRFYSDYGVDMEASFLRKKDELSSVQYVYQATIFLFW